MYDVLIIGCGIIGAATAFELSKYDLSVGVLERYNDVANGATKANSAILHAGFDPLPTTKMAPLNIEGVKLAKKICKDMSVEYRELPSLVLAFSERDQKHLSILYDRGIKNGVSGMKILSREEALRLEPNLSPDITGALYAPAAIVDPWGYALAMAEVAVTNGVDIHLSCEVTGINRLDCGDFEVESTGGVFRSKYIINAAGAFSENIHEMVGGTEFMQDNVCGQYYVLDKNEGKRVNSVIFQCPDERGKGVLVAPTVHGNLIVGPDAFRVNDGDSVATDKDTIHLLKARGMRSVPSINFREVIHEYAGVRPNTQIDDFIIGESDACKNFINLAGIKSPGLSAAPAIALEALRILSSCGLALNEKASYETKRSRVIFKQLSDEEKAKIIEKDPLYGHIVCRCETVTEGEIVEAIHRPIVPRSIDAIKRRCNAGMGRCQGGFCSPKVHEILARELGVRMDEILMDEDGSYVLTGRTKEDARYEK